MASAEREPSIRGSGAEPAPAGSRGRAPGQRVRGRSPLKLKGFRHYTSKEQAIFAPLPNF